MKTLGHYRVPENGEHEFEVAFENPALLPFQWVHCDSTATALASYFSAFFPERAQGDEVGREEMAFSVNYVANELLENVHKFGSGKRMELRACMTETDLLLWTRNAAPAEARVRLESVISGILQGDPQELLLERIEQNALNPESSASGLGYLTMMSDYGVRFGWAFREQANDTAVVETQAWLPIRRKDLP